MVNSDKKIICLECGDHVANSNNVLARHVRTTHDIDWPDYIVKHQYGGRCPTCACGCSQELSWRKGGFKQYIKGHENKGDENPMHITKRVPRFIDGWIVNPWTGEEEHMSDPDVQMLFIQCIAANDPVTSAHAFNVGYVCADDIERRHRITFKHLKKDIIMDINSFGGHDGHRCLSAVKRLCDNKGLTLIILQRRGDEFYVMGGHRPNA